MQPNSFELAKTPPIYTSTSFTLRHCKRYVHAAEQKSDSGELRLCTGYV